MTTDQKITLYMLGLEHGARAACIAAFCEEVAA